MSRGVLYTANTDRGEFHIKGPAGRYVVLVNCVAILTVYGEYRGCIRATPDKQRKIDPLNFSWESLANAPEEYVLDLESEERITAFASLWCQTGKPPL